MATSAAIETGAAALLLTAVFVLGGRVMFIRDRRNAISFAAACRRHTCSCT